MFLRGMPHLCKKMKRPGASGKLSANPDQEPDLYKIGDVFPIRDSAGNSADNQAILLQCTVEGGPKARMPVHMGLQLSPGPSTSSDCSIDPIETPYVDEDHRKMAAEVEEIAVKQTEIALKLDGLHQLTKPFAPATLLSSSVSATSASKERTPHQNKTKIAAKNPYLAPKPIEPQPSVALHQQLLAAPRQEQPAFTYNPSSAGPTHQPAVAIVAKPQSSIMTPFCVASLALQQQRLSQQLVATQQAQAVVQAQANAFASEIASQLKPQPTKSLVPQVSQELVATQQAQANVFASEIGSQLKLQPPNPLVSQVSQDTVVSSQFAAGFAAAAALSSGAIQAVLRQAFANAALPLIAQPQLPQLPIQASPTDIAGLTSKVILSQSQSPAFPLSNLQHFNLPPKDPTHGSEKSHQKNSP